MIKLKIALFFTIGLLLCGLSIGVHAFLIGWNYPKITHGIIENKRAYIGNMFDRELVYSITIDSSGYKKNIIVSNDMYNNVRVGQYF